VTEVPARSRVPIVLFFVSGAAGLVYQISWSRQIGLWFGHTAQAAAIVLAAFFAGLALGNEVGARILPRVRRPLVGYGVAEIAVAVWALLVPVLLDAMSGGPLAGLVNHDAAAVRLLARAGASLAVLLPATTAMGATLPFVAEWASPARGHAPRRAAAAYAVNTAGGVAGVLLATFALILFAGVEGSARLAAAGSALVGIAAIAIARREAGDAAAAEAAADRIAGVWWALAAISGAGTLALEVLYVRLFALSLHNSTYTFGCVVAVFLVALAAGAAIVARVGERVDPRRGAAVAAGVGALAIGVSLAVFRALTGWEALPEGGGLVPYLARTLGVTTLVVLPPVALLGCVLPFGWIALGRGGVGAGVGRLVAVNTVAAAAGSLAAEFALVPALGAWGSVAAVAALYLATAAALVLRGPEARRAWVWLAPAALLLPPALLWGRERPFLRAGEEIVREWPTAYGLFDVVRDGHGELALRQDRQYVHGSTKGADTELRQGHLPLLLHPAPRRVLFLGLGTGFTSSAAALHPEVESVEVVELVPEVVEASRLFVADVAKRRVVVNDARHHLAATKDSFDVIVSDLFFPWHSGTGYLYTVEHYRAGRARLAESGLFAQWIALYQVGLEDFLLIADSFASVFPVTTLWRGELGEWQPLMLLVGSEEPLALDGATLARRLAALQAAGWDDSVLVEARDVLDLYAGDWSPQRPDRLNTDEHPRVEFLAPVANRAQTQLAWRLGEFYRRWLERLPAAGVRYAPQPGEGPWSVGGGRLRQLVGGERQSQRRTDAR
jgi:spermidine synthase